MECTEKYTKKNTRKVPFQGTEKDIYYYTKKYTRNNTIFDPTFYKENDFQGTMEKEYTLTECKMVLTEEPRWIQKLLHIVEESKKEYVEFEDGRS